MAGGQQFIDGGLITIGPLRLIIRRVRPADLRAFVPIDAQPAQPVQDRRQRLLDVPLLVGVVDPQDELPAVLPGEQPAKKRGANAADVKISGRTGCESSADHGRGEGIGDRGQGFGDWKTEKVVSGYFLIVNRKLTTDN